MVVVMSSAIAVIEDFSQDTLGRYEKCCYADLILNNYRFGN